MQWEFENELPIEMRIRERRYREEYVRRHGPLVLMEDRYELEAISNYRMTIERLSASDAIRVGLKHTRMRKHHHQSVLDYKYRNLFNLTEIAEMTADDEMFDCRALFILMEGDVSYWVGNCWQEILIHKKLITADPDRNVTWSQQWEKRIILCDEERWKMWAMISSFIRKRHRFTKRVVFRVGLLAILYTLGLNQEMIMSELNYNINQIGKHRCIGIINLIRQLEQSTPGNNNQPHSCDELRHDYASSDDDRSDSSFDTGSSSTTDEDDGYYKNDYAIEIKETQEWDQVQHLRIPRILLHWGLIKGEIKDNRQLTIYGFYVCLDHYKRSIGRNGT